MTLQVIIDDFNKQQWEHYASEFADYSIYQTWAYQQVRADMSRQKISRIIVRNEKGNIATMGQVRIRHFKALGLKVGYIQWGPMLRGKDGRFCCIPAPLDKLREYYLSTKVDILRVVPNLYADEGSFTDMFEAAGFEYVPNVSRYHTMLFPLDISQEKMRKKLHRKWRGVLNKVEKRNIEIKEGCDDKFLAVLDGIYKSVKKRKKFKGLDLQVYARTQQLLSPKQKINVVLAYYDGEVLTADATSYLGDTAVGLFQASTEQGLKYGTSYLVWWKALLAAQHAGMKRYDLGGIDPDKNPSVYQFKLRMGAEEAFHIGSFEACISLRAKVTWRMAEKVYNMIKE